MFAGFQHAVAVFFDSVDAQLHAFYPSGVDFVKTGPKFVYVTVEFGELFLKSPPFLGEVVNVLDDFTEVIFDHEVAVAFDHHPGDNQECERGNEDDPFFHGFADHFRDALVDEGKDHLIGDEQQGEVEGAFFRHDVALHFFDLLAHITDKVFFGGFLFDGALRVDHFQDGGVGEFHIHGDNPVFWEQKRYVWLQSRCEVALLGVVGPFNESGGVQNIVQHEFAKLAAGLVVREDVAQFFRSSLQVFGDFLVLADAGGHFRKLFVPVLFHAVEVLLPGSEFAAQFPHHAFNLFLLVLQVGGDDFFLTGEDALALLSNFAGDLTKDFIHESLEEVPLL